MRETESGIDAAEGAHALFTRRSIHGCLVNAYKFDTIRVVLEPASTESVSIYPPRVYPASQSEVCSRSYNVTRARAAPHARRRSQGSRFASRLLYRRSSFDQDNSSMPDDEARPIFSRLRQPLSSLFLFFSPSIFSFCKVRKRLVRAHALSVSQEKKRRPAGLQTHRGLITVTGMIYAPIVACYYLRPAAGARAFVLKIADLDRFIRAAN